MAYTAAEKLEAIEHAIMLARRHHPNMMIKGTLTKRNASKLRDLLTQIASEYRQQAIEEKKVTTPESSGLASTAESSTVDTP